MSPQNVLGRAVAYTKKLEKPLLAYTEDPHVPIDNNPVERSIRPAVLGRKNYLFAGNESGGQAAGIFYSLIESAKRNGHDAAEYLRDIFLRLPSHPANRRDELLPDRWKPLPQPSG